MLAGERRKKKTEIVLIRKEMEVMCEWLENQLRQSSSGQVEME